MICSWVNTSMKSYIIRWGLIASLLGMVVVFVAGQHDTSASDKAAQVNLPYVAVARGWVDISGGLVHVNSSVGGVVDAVLVNEGDEVKRNQKLLQFNTEQVKIEIAINKAELLRAKAAKNALLAKLAYTSRRVQKLRMAVHNGALPGESEAEAVMKAKLLAAQLSAAAADIQIAKQRTFRSLYALKRTSIRTPVSGSIVKRMVHTGDSVASSDTLFEIIPKKPLIIRAEVNETFINNIRPGMEAEIKPNGSQNTFKAHVLMVGKVFGLGRISNDPGQSTYENDVQVILTASQSGLRIGQHVLVRFLSTPAPGKK